MKYQFNQYFYDFELKNFEFSESTIIHNIHDINYLNFDLEKIFVHQNILQGSI